MRYQFNNYAYESWFGRAAGDLRGMTLEEALGEDAFAAIRPYAEAALNGELVEYESEIAYRDGGTRWIHASYVPDRAGDQVRGFYALVTDISARKREESEIDLLANLGSAIAGSLDVQETARGIVRAAVPAFADISTITMRAEDGSLIRIALDVAQPDDIAVSRFPINENEQLGPTSVMRTGEPYFEREVSDQLLQRWATSPQHLAALRDARPTSAMTVPVVVSGEVRAAITFSTREGRRPFDDRDFAFAQALAGRCGLAFEKAELFEETQRTMADLRKANAAKDEFLGMVSHELKTPITVIYGNAEVLRTRSARIDPETQASSIADISREADRLHRIIDNLLVLARLEQGVTFDEEPLFIKRIAFDAVSRHRQRFPHRKLDLVLPDDLPLVTGQPVYVEQVLGNLLSNAEKYSPPDKPIKVTLKAQGGEVCVAILDRGPGFAAGDAEKLFTPFYRAPETSAVVSGVGIGLAVCKRLIEAQGGRMWARRRSGGGADIGFALPAILDDEEASPGPSADASAAARPSRRRR
jgi:PAS domain S-box-containing protein